MHPNYNVLWPRIKQAAKFLPLMGLVQLEAPTAILQRNEKMGAEHVGRQGMTRQFTGPQLARLN
jgi:hypothetical protein